MIVAINTDGSESGLPALDDENGGSGGEGSGWTYPLVGGQVTGCSGTGG